MEEPTRVSILGEDRIIVDYDIWGAYIVNDLFQNVSSSTYVLVTDTNLYSIYVPSFQKIFREKAVSLKNNARLLTYQIPPGETSKSRAMKAEVEDWMLSKDRDPPGDTKTVVIALGGGVVGDLLGFVAATFKRGIRFVQVPTTLLAMVDSSIGGKTAIDTSAGKNLVGAFWQPSRIYVDLNFLNSLPSREFINGLAEVIKTAAIWNEKAFQDLETHAGLLIAAIESPPTSDGSRLSSVKEILKNIVIGSVRVKAEVVTKDEREGGLRNILNFGHSIGHAIESILAPQILHGECVAVGMVLETLLARYLGILDSGVVARLTKCITSYKLPTTVNDKTLMKRSAGRKCSVDQLMIAMGIDKKNDGKNKRVVLLEEIGQIRGRQASVVTDEDIRVILSSGIKVYPSASKSLDISCTPPGSKSISNRVMVLAALGSGTCRIKNLLHSDDTEYMMSALIQLQGASFEWEGSGKDLIVTGRGGELHASKDTLYLGNAGTAARFLTTVATLAKASRHPSTILTGNHRMQERPIGPLVDALRGNGAEISYMKPCDGFSFDEKTAEEIKRKNGSALPLRITASGGMAGGVIDLHANESSQYVSSILMCAPRAKKAVTLRMVGGVPISQPYIDMTIAMMASFGVQVTRSETEEHTYHIPQATYRNPPEYAVESDASSATYPLAIAAITGTTCTVPNIGSKSLQGDAKFATEVLRPMGCRVKQDENSTTVEGPPLGSLRSIEEVDMTTMTDAFLTASVLGALARSKGHSRTRIIGIANQQKKESERIAVMRDQLEKFGITSRLYPNNEAPDGIEIDGLSPKALKDPKGGVDCYDDHRVAMAFSVLALVTPHGAQINDRNCTGKTWPGWWDTLRQCFKAQLEGVDLATPSSPQPLQSTQKSIFIIGMRGAGKTTTGKWAAKSLQYTFVDLDEQLELEAASTIPEIIADHGWEEFRKQEYKVLSNSLSTKPTRHVFACGGGIVETPEARQFLINYHRSGGLVLLIQRNIEDVIDFLNEDKTRPAYVDDIRGVWLRRKDWYDECSNHLFISQKASSHQLSRASKDFEHFLLFVTGQHQPLEAIENRKQSSFVSLTIPDLTTALEYLPAVCVGSDAVELRVDLLKDSQNPEGLVSPDFVANQVTLLRLLTDLPLIFTLRTAAQGGQFPVHAEDQVLVLSKLALRLGVEFLDLELHWPDRMLTTITGAKGRSKIIASHHDFKGTLSWKNGSWVPHYNKGLLYGDIIKLVGTATAQDDNIALAEFKRGLKEVDKTPLIAINMGLDGQLSRIQNEFLTPVSHEALPFKAAPGQLSAREIRTALTLHGVIKPKKFFLFGKPISQSRSPALHNTMFESQALPHKYGLLETDCVKDLEDTLLSPIFGGASVTIPLKLDIMPYLDQVSEDARVIGAVNTIIVDESRLSKSGKGHFLTGRNTDWQGMKLVLENAGAQFTGGQSGVVIGGGGTARAAIYALHALDYSPIYLLGRSASKMQLLAQSFPSDYPLQVIESEDEAKKMKMPTVAIGTIPANEPIQEGLRQMLAALFKIDQEVQPRILLEMAYKPAVTALMSMAQGGGWTTIAGLEALAAQGLYQFQAWTGINPLYDDVRDAVMRG